MTELITNLPRYPNQFLDSYHQQCFRCRIAGPLMDKTWDEATRLSVFSTDPSARFPAAWRGALPARPLVIHQTLLEERVGDGLVGLQIIQDRANCNIPQPAECLMSSLPMCILLPARELRFALCRLPTLTHCQTAERCQPFSSGRSVQVP